MRKSILALTVVAALALAGSAFARPGMGPGGGAGMGPGAGPGMGGCYKQGAAATPEQTAQYKKFIADTLPLKEQMHAKHMEIKREWIKEKPDNDKIAKLQGELQTIHQKLSEAREKAGFQKMRNGGKKGGRGMGYGAGQGCGPCGGPGYGPGAAQPAPTK